MALEGTLILYVLRECPREAKENFGSGSLGKAAIQLIRNLGFLKAKFKEIFSYIGKEKPTQEKECTRKTATRKAFLP